MSEASVNHVDAVFGGKEVRFQIDREDIHVLEASLEMPAYQTFTKLAGGFWSIRDVETVLTIASMAIGLSESERKLVAIYRGAPSGMRHSGISTSGMVRSVLVDNPPGRYSVLALKVLEALLFGIDPADAHFDENEGGLADG